MMMQDPLFGPLAAMIGLGGFAFSLLFVFFIVWALLWKSLALWYAARNGQKAWFVVLLIVNTVGILEIVYLLFFRKNANKAGAHALFGLPDKVSAATFGVSSSPSAKKD